MVTGGRYLLAIRFVSLVSAIINRWFCNTNRVLEREQKEMKLALDQELRELEQMLQVCAILPVGVLMDYNCVTFQQILYYLS